MAVVKALCEAGANTDWALISAAAHCKGIAVNAPEGAAARARSASIAVELLKHGARADSNSLQFACQFDVYPLAKLLIEHGADVNDVIERSGLTALMVAAENASLPLVSLLLQHGADVHATEPERRWTALHYACTCTSAAGDADKIRSLLNVGASPNAASVTGSTPLWLAASVSDN